ncbi:MAG TPA: SDR family oxidoreductase [Polyangiaceae bacterium]
MNTELTDKLAVVTGVTSGIGEAITFRLLDAGARVVGIGRNEEKLALLRERRGERFVPLAVDLTVADQRRQAIARLEKQVTPIDVLVNNAAECAYESPLAMDLDRLRRLFEVNVFACLDLAQALVPRMERGGHIVQLSSVTARFAPNARFAPYAVSKLAIERFVESMRLELHPRGIKVSLMVPGLVDTPIYDKVRGFETTRAKIREQVKDWLAPDDVAEAVLWMLTRPAGVIVSEMVIMPREQAR